MDLMTGSEVGAYVVERRLGMGGMAVVYLVRHRRLGTLHALKMLDRRAGSVQDRLLLEGQVQAALKHPNIVDVTDIVDVDGLPGLILEYVHGFHLGEFLQQLRPNTEQIDALVQGILTGVRVAHQAGLVHRDLKPANILLQITDDGLIPKVADFGLAKSVVASPELTQTGHAMGTPAYMAPEQVRDAKNVDQRADLFSLGAILYEIATGSRAFQGDSGFEIHQKICAGEYPPLDEVAPDLEPRMATAIEQALIVDPDERVASCERLLALWMGVDEVTSEGPWDAGALREVQDYTAMAPTLSAVPIGMDTSALSQLIEAAESRRSVLVPSLSSLPSRAAQSVPVRVVAVLGVAIGLVGMGWYVGQGGPQAPPQPQPQPIQVAPPEPEPVPAPPEPEPEPEPVAEPAPKVAPQPAPRPRPAPRPAPAPPPEPAPAPVATGVVHVTGDASRVILVSGDQRHAAPGTSIPAGLYDVHASFDGGDPKDSALDVRVEENGEVTINCDASFVKCAIAL